MRRAPHVIENVRVGRPDVRPSAPSHVRGVHEGNESRHVARNEGIVRLAPEGERDDEPKAVGTARRSTGVASRRHGPIDPRMPNLSPP